MNCHGCENDAKVSLDCVAKAWIQRTSKKTNSHRSGKCAIQRSRSRMYSDLGMTRVNMNQMVTKQLALMS